MMKSLGRMLKVYLGWTEILLAGICFGFLGIFGRLASANNIPIGELLSGRFVVAASLLWLWSLCFNREILRLPRRQILISCLLGVCGYAVFSTMYFRCIEGVSVAVAAMLLFTFPIFVNLGAFFILKHPMPRKQIAGLVIACLGLVMLLWGDFSVSKMSAVFWGLGAAIVYALYVLISGEVQREVNPLSSSLYVISAAALTLLVIHRPDLARMLNYELKQQLIILGIAIVCTLAPLTLFLAGMQKTTSSKASIIVMIEPVTAALAGWLLLGEVLSARQMLGGLIVLAGLVISREEGASLHN